MLVCAQNWVTKLALVFGVVLSLAAASADARPMRIVSLNLCSDQLLVALADREQIASVSFFAADPRFSLITDQIHGLPLNHGLAEEVLALKPDLILAGNYTARYAVDHARKRGVPVVELEPAHDFEQIAARIMTVGKAIGHEARATKIVADMNRALQRLDAQSAETSLQVLSFASGGATIGAPSLFNAVVTRAGHTNLPAKIGMGSWGQIGLEGIIQLKPDYVLLEGLQQKHNSLTRDLMQHRAIRKLLDAGKMKLAPVDGRLWSCGGPHTVKAVAGFKQLGAGQ